MSSNTDVSARAQLLYVCYYGRPADPVGLSFWINQLNRTSSVDEVLVQFGQSAEYNAIQEDYPTNRALVNRLYQVMFNRDAEQEGLDFYLGLLDRGERSLASIALDIALGAQNEDREILDNKVAVANTFTSQVRADNVPYTAAHIPAAQAILAAVDETSASVRQAEAMVREQLQRQGGVVELDDNEPEGDYSDSPVGVTVTLDGNNDETAFVVTGSAFNDRFILEDFLSVRIQGNAGTDTLDLTRADGDFTLSLDTGTFSSDDDGDGLPDYTGRIFSIETVLGSDGDDRITGSGNADTLSGGDGSDLLRGGGGNDVFLYEDESDLDEDVGINGQTGTDIVDFSDDSVDLSAVDSDKLSSIETLRLSNGDGSSNVRLTLGGVGGIAPDEFDRIEGSSALDRLVLENSTGSDLSDTTLFSIEQVSSNGDLVIAPGTLTGINILSRTGSGNGVITLGSAGVYDFSSITLSGWDHIEGSDAVGDVVVLRQTQVDALLDGAPDDDIFHTGFDDTGVTPNNVPVRDTFRASGSLDLTEISVLSVAELAFGTASTIEINESSLRTASLQAITGAGGSLVINDDNDDGMVDLTINAGGSGVALVNITRVEIEATDATLRINAAGLSGVDRVVMAGDEGTLEINDNETVDLGGVDFAGFDGILFGSAAGSGNLGSVRVDQRVLDEFSDWGNGLSGGDTLEFVMAGARLNLRDVDFTDTFNSATALVKVVGTSDGDTVIGFDADDEDEGMDFVYELGAGNDSFTGTDKTNDNGMETVKGEAGNDTIVLAVPDVAGAASEAYGGRGNDRITAADSADVLQGGLGNDTFTVAMTQLGVTINDFNTNLYTQNSTLVAATRPLTADQRTGNDLLRLNINVAADDVKTAFSDVLVNNRLRVLTTNKTDNGKYAGVLKQLAANRALGSGDDSLQSLADTAAARAFLDTGNTRTDSLDLGDEEFVFFALSGTGQGRKLVAFVVTADDDQEDAITANEIAMVTLVNLPGDGVFAEADLFLV